MPSTQQRHPWRATLRTVLAAAAGLAPVLVAVSRDVPELAPYLGLAIVVAGVATRLLAIPEVDGWLAGHRPTAWAASEPHVTGRLDPETLQLLADQVRRARDELDAPPDEDV